MIISKDTGAKRLIIYFMYDKDGVIDDYVIYALKCMKRVSSEILVVCNGKLTDVGRQKLDTVADTVFIRENKGFDVWAYKEALNHYGWDKLQNLDEIVMMNFTIMGPVYPIEEMFDKMDAQDLDFWGLSMFYGFFDGDPFGVIDYGYIPAHLQSHFIAVRKPLFTSAAFKQYWDEMPPITCYNEAVGYHEAIFTKKFADMGFSWAVYAGFDDGSSHNPLICAPKRMLEEKRCPFFKRRSFMQDFSVMLNETGGQVTMELYDFLRDHTDYDLNLFWDNILRLENVSVLKRNLAWNYILPSDQSKDMSSVLEKKSLALVMHIYYIDQAEVCLSYARSMPETTDVYITSDTEEKVARIREVFASLPCKSLTVKQRENRGRDLSTLLVTFRKEILQHDYVCYVHDKKVKQMEPQTVGAGFAFKCLENTLSSRHFVNNVLDTFEKNPRLGLLAPPPPFHAGYYFLLGHEWGPNYEGVKKLVKEWHLHVPMRPDCEPVSAMGSMFWFRTAAMKKELEIDWKFTDFPAEPVADDGTILHAIERVHGYVVQDAGYYPASLFSDRGARVELGNTEYMLRTLNQTIYRNGIGGISFNQTNDFVNTALARANMRLLKFRDMLVGIPVLGKMMQGCFHLLLKIRRLFVRQPQPEASIDKEKEEEEEGVR